MTAHAEDALGRSRIAEVLNLPLAVPAAEAGCTEGLLTGEDGQILDLVSAGGTAVCAVVADQGSVAKEEKVRIGVEQGAAGVASETVQVPSIPS